MNKEPVCPYCGGAMRIVVCDDEGNVVHNPETYLKNPWSGLTYGIQHNLKDVPEGYTCPIASFEEDNERMGTRLYDTENDAYNALFQRIPRFPRKPLEFDQIFEKDGVFIETTIGGESVCYPVLFDFCDQEAGFPTGGSEKEDSVYYKVFGKEAKYAVAVNEYGKSWRCWGSYPMYGERLCAEWMNNPCNDEV